MNIDFLFLYLTVAGISPPAGANTWTPDKCQQFRNLIKGNTYKAQVIDKDDVQLHVELIAEPGGKKLSDYMVQHMGVERKRHVSTQRNKEEEAPMKEKGPNMKNSGKAVLQKNPAASAFKSPPQTQRNAKVMSQQKDSQSESPFLDRFDQSKQGTHDGRRQSKSPAKTTQDMNQSKAATPEKASSSNVLRLPIGHSKAAGVFVRGPHEFYIQSAKESDIQKFSDLTQEINAFYEASEEVYSPAVEELVTAYYEKDR